MFQVAAVHQQQQQQRDFLLSRYKFAPIKHEPMFFPLVAAMQSNNNNNNSSIKLDIKNEIEKCASQINAPADTSSTTAATHAAATIPSNFLAATTTAQNLDAAASRFFLSFLSPQQQKSPQTQ